MLFFLLKFSFIPNTSPTIIIHTYVGRDGCEKNKLKLPAVSMLEAGMYMCGLSSLEYSPQLAAPEVQYYICGWFYMIVVVTVYVMLMIPAYRLMLVIERRIYYNCICCDHEKECVRAARILVLAWPLTILIQLGYGWWYSYDRYHVNF